MAAYAALVSLEQTIEPILPFDEPPNLYETYSLKSLHKNIAFLRKFLEDFPDKANKFEDRIRNAANQTEDIIEHFVLDHNIPSYSISTLIVGLRHILDQNVETPPYRSEKLKLMQTVKFAELYPKLPKLIDEIDSIVKQVLIIQSNDPRVAIDLPLSDPSSARPVSRVASRGKEVIVGLDDDLMAIKARLCGESSKIQVIPIVGMGGIGKTTLARIAYNDPLIVEQFHIRSWVTVTQNHSTLDIFRSILVSIKAWDKEPSKIDNERLGEHVYKSLKGRKYFIVLDDVWSTKAWDDLKMMLPNDHNGSRIILTTRIEEMAAYADPSSPIHKVHLMDVHKSWYLLQQKIFSQGHCPVELKNIGKVIARSCRGLPLAIVAAAGFLWTCTQTQASWQIIADNIANVFTSSDDQLESIFSLSYYHLPHHLRPCLLYMGCFPEDYEIYVPELIRFWIAEGFLRPGGSKSLEEVAEEYLEDLVKRNLLLVKKMKSNGKIKSFSVHDVIRDMCVRKAQEENFVRHGTYNHEMRRYSRPYRLRTIFNDPQTISYRFPTHILRLPNLKYLSLTLRNQYEFPHIGIENLQNLQTLIILPELRLPLSILQMPRLRHTLSDSIVLFPLPNDQREYSGALPNLQTLQKVENLICSKKLLETFPNIKKFGLFYRSIEIWSDQSQLENLVYLKQLENLKINVDRDASGRWSFPGSLAFPTALKKLSLSNCRFSWADMGTNVGSLPNLEVLKLRNDACIGSVWETNEGGFLRLKLLEIKNIRDLEHWISESSHFPRLERLILHAFWKLREIPEDIGEIPTLELIEIDNCNEWIVDSARKMLKEQESMGNDTFQVRLTDRYGNLLWLYSLQ